MLRVLDFMAVNGKNLYVCELGYIREEIDSVRFDDFGQIGGKASGQMIHHVAPAGGLKRVEEGASADPEECIALEPFATGAGF
jgi:hypothetical protein